MPAVAITDTGNLFGALEFATACADAGIQPIIGIEIALAPRARRGRDAAAAATGTAAEPDRIVLLVQSETGYRNLIGLSAAPISTARPGPSRAIALADLGAASEGLICLAGGAGGPIGRLLAEGQADAAEAVLLALEAAFPGRLYIELHAARHAGGGAQRGRADRSRLSPTICRWSRPTTPISRTAISTRRTTRCCASRRAASSPIPTASG